MIDLRKPDMVTLWFVAKNAPPTGREDARRKTRQRGFATRSDARIWWAHNCDAYTLSAVHDAIVGSVVSQSEFLAWRVNANRR